MSIIRPLDFPIEISTPHAEDFSIGNVDPGTKDATPNLIQCENWLPLKSESVELLWRSGHSRRNEGCQSHQLGEAVAGICNTNQKEKI